MSTHDPNLRYPPMLNEFRWAANGSAPDGGFVGSAANAINHCVAYRRKLVAEYWNDCGNIPAGQSGTNTVTRIHCHTGVGCDKLVGVFNLAPASNGTDPYVDVYVAWSGDNTTSGEIHYGGISATWADAPDWITWGHSLLIPGIPPDTDCQIHIRLSDYARILSFCIYEIGNVPVDTTESGVDPRIGVGSPIYDDPIEQMVKSCSEQWRHNAGNVLQFLSHDDNTTRYSIEVDGAASYKNIFESGSTTVTAATPGYRVNLQYHNSANQSAVPVTMAVYASADGDGDAKVKLTDGTNELETGGITSLDWYTVTGTIPATDDQKWDIHAKPDTGEGVSIRVYSVCVYELD